MPAFPLRYTRQCRFRAGESSGLAFLRIPARIDPTRIVEGVIGGIGFLGAGSIIRSGGSVHGVTTGAAIWIAGSIGVACATGNLVLAVMVTALTMVIVLVLGALENRFQNGSGGERTGER